MLLNKLGRALRTGCTKLNACDARNREYKSNYKQYRFLQQHARLKPGTMGWAESYVHSGVKMNFRNASYFDIGVAEGSSHFVELA